MNPKGKGGSSVLSRKGLCRDLETRRKAWSGQNRESGTWPWQAWGFLLILIQVRTTRGIWPLSRILSWLQGLFWGQPTLLTSFAGSGSTRPFHQVKFLRPLFPLLSGLSSGLLLPFPRLQVASTRPMPRGTYFKIRRTTDTFFVMSLLMFPPVPLII